MVICLAQVGCKKSNSFSPSPTSLQGTWKMVKVTDNVSGEATTKPSSVQKDIKITFAPTGSSGGVFFGNTPANLIGNSPYSTGANQSISMISLMMTKVGEEPWGYLFVDNITAAEQYSFEVGGLLNIKTANKKVLTFSKQ